jgi:hypothetical protein
MLVEIRNFVAKIRNPDRRYEDLARPVLQEYLDRSHTALTALRSFAQARERYTDADREIFPELERVIERESDGNLNFYDGFLCVITDSNQLFQEHDGVSVGFEKLGQAPRAVKGMYFQAEWNSLFFRCVLLDNGLSRHYFDRKSEPEKQTFVRRFGYSRSSEFPLSPHEIEWATDYTAQPRTFAAFASDSGDRFTIDTIAVIRPLLLD